MNITRRNNKSTHRIVMYVVCIFVLGLYHPLFAGGQKSASPEGAVLMRVGDIENVANLGAIALDKFSQEITATSGGLIEVKAFHAAQMGSANKQLELVKSGTLEAFRGSISWLAQFDTGFSLIDFPFLAQSPQQVKIIANSSVMQELNNELAARHGIRFVTAGWIRLPRQILVSKPVATVGDIKGVKLRVPEAYSYIQSFRALGVSPTPVSFNETYLALKQGVVEGAENHVESLYTMKWHEVVKHLVVIDHSYDITGFIVNDVWWQKLSEVQRSMIVETFDTIDEWFEQENAQLQQKYIDLMVAEGVVVHHVDKASFRDHVYPTVMLQAELAGEWKTGLFEKVIAML